MRCADVVIENYRSGALAALGLGYDDVAAINPTINYCSLTGFGQTGPKAEHTAAKKPERKAWHAEVVFDNKLPAVDFEGGLQTTVTLWEKDHPHGFPLGTVNDTF